MTSPWSELKAVITNQVIARCWTDYQTLYKIILTNTFSQGSFLYAPSQWDTTSQCNVVSHWLGAYIEWFLVGVFIHSCLVTRICVRQRGNHWFVLWLVSCSVPSQYLNLCWLIANYSPRNAFCSTLIMLRDTQGRFSFKKYAVWNTLLVFT